MTLIKSTDTVLMTLCRKELTSGAIKGLTVCYFTLCALFVLLGKPVQRNTKQHVLVGRIETCVVYT
ncbi:unnamed protein product [Staurois parvus]|uniref:Uncharacterized protein n=1 Tax=Staurois parvus TaxID=386267 RepID=A0ABN9G173_9NEOB|nr:unnamed protein product [Staurois parvus]CAI9603116.1 unnamed protein product [Staurois parvus]